MQEVTLFNFEGNQVRTIEHEDIIWFAMIDIARVLGLSNPSVSIKSLDSDERAKFNLGRQGNTNFVNEPGLYKLIGSSRKQQAKRFNRWVTHDVLPSIRKNGVYMTDQTAYDITHDKDALGDLLLKAGSQLKQKDLVIQELKPKADYTDSMLANKGLETISMIAKNYGYSTREFNKLLHGLGIQYKQGKTWLLYAKYQDEGYTHVEPYEYTNNDGIKQVRNTMKWTQAGQKFLYDFLKSKGIMPLVEQPI
ncbi:phage antirepressor KilAC domain-containing protein [Lactiplantibacillus plantarum]|uniref:phage antirepressor n=1 Tax=Lactiplantibacillus plantarum TaxID=1590 RepID=UPI0009353C89|nr:phage antirepressor KilAC domain-containing protein [Lactiplantibacillus plantarum]QLK66733.1 phage repressor protein/antirepressor Ant [Lactiplantibacillus plantarum]WKE63356.1 phage antirepressor KilAC domain-containing protein [Lactiplantibacillus plantarum]WOD60539.1 phage antirepressor KilAC domain-containing protein [Lactiplantibacillus plantarum]WQH17754.1 phage antirepressor KilAC domain-containing protein [Lactiplantibacillus plantarum]